MAAGSAEVIDNLHLFHPRKLRVDARRKFYPMLYDPVDFAIMESFRKTVSRKCGGSDEATVTLSAKVLETEFAGISPICLEDPSLSVVGEGSAYGIQCGAIHYGNAVLGGSELRFEFSRPGRYAADICIQLSDSIESCVRLSTWRKLPGIKLGHTLFSECYSPCRDRLTFLFDVVQEVPGLLVLEMATAERQAALRWAKFTRLETGHHYR